MAELGPFDHDGLVADSMCGDNVPFRDAALVVGFVVVEVSVWYVDDDCWDVDAPSVDVNKVERAVDILFESKLCMKEKRRRNGVVLVICSMNVVNLLPLAQTHMHIRPF